MTRVDGRWAERRGHPGAGGVAPPATGAAHCFAPPRGRTLLPPLMRWATPPRSSLGAAVRNRRRRVQGECIRAARPFHPFCTLSL